MGTAAGDYWNHNVHYQRVIQDAVPERCGAAVDVGCGDGLLACKLAARCAAVTANLWYKRTRGEGNPGAPIMEPDMTWSQVRSAAARLLPGARYRRHLLWRYSVTWVKPAQKAGGSV
jgi:hypothetical protein